jgi:hypothetical protein
MVLKRKCKVSVERAKAIERKKKSRLGTENLDFENSVNTRRCQILGSDPEYRGAERTRDAQDHQKLRTEMEYRELERSRDVEGHQALRQDPSFRRQEQERDCEHHQVLRQDQDFRRQEQVRDKTARFSINQSINQVYCPLYWP